MLSTQKTSKTASQSEDDILAGLVTNRSETSSYESNVLRQATLQLAPTLKLEDGPTKQVGYPELATLLPFPAGHKQAKSNRKIVTQVLLQLQRQMIQAENTDQFPLLAMKQQILLRLLGGSSGSDTLPNQKPTMRQLCWNQQPKVQEIYQQVERASLLKSSSRPTRVPMMQRKQIQPPSSTNTNRNTIIPGSSSLAKAAQGLDNQQSGNNNNKKSKAWKDWSSEDEDDDESGDDETNNNPTTRAVLAEMIYSRRRDNKKVAPRRTRNEKPRSQQTTPKGKNIQKQAAVKKSTATTRMGSSRRSSPRNTNNSNHNEPQIQQFPAVEQSRPKRQRTKVISYAEKDSDDDDGEVAAPTSNDDEEAATTSNDDEVEATTSNDDEVAATTSSCMEVKIEEGEEMVTTSRKQSKRKSPDAANTTSSDDATRKKQTIKAELPDDFVMDDEGSNQDEELEVDGGGSTSGDNFMFDNDLDEEEDEDQDAPLEKPTSLDDYRLDDYEDRVDWWRLNGLGEMKDLSQLRAEGESDPGATTLDGGLHVPAWMNNRLFQYQRTGLEWMWTLHQQQAGGVLGRCSIVRLAMMNECMIRIRLNGMESGCVKCRMVLSCSPNAFFFLFSSEGDEMGLG